MYHIWEKRKKYHIFKNILRLLQQFIQTVKGRNNFWNLMLSSFRFFRSNTLDQFKFELEKVIGIWKPTGKIGKYSNVPWKLSWDKTFVIFFGFFLLMFSLYCDNIIQDFDLKFFRFISMSINTDLEFLVIVSNFEDFIFQCGKNFWEVRILEKTSGHQPSTMARKSWRKINKFLQFLIKQAWKRFRPPSAIFALSN